VQLENNREMRCQFVQQCSATTSYEALPQLQLHRVVVTLTPAEMAMYSSLRNGVKSRMLRLLFCSHHMLNNAAWVEKNLRHFMQEGPLEIGRNNAAAQQQGTVTTSLMTVDEVATAMQSRRQHEIETVNATLLDQIERFITLWLEIREATADAGLLEQATAEIDAEMRAQEQMRAHAVTSSHVDTPPPPMLTLNYLGEITEVMLDGWRDRRDIRICMALTRLDEDLIRRGITLRAQHTMHVNNRVGLLRQRERVLAEFNFFRNIFERLTKPEESIECPVCLSDEHTKEAIVLSVCGHEFCTECAKMLFRARSQCAVCRRQLRIPADLRLVDRTQAPAPPPPPPSQSKRDGSATTVDPLAASVASVRDTYGSKLAALIPLIQRILNRRDCKKIVIFAQFQRLLLLIADVLRQNGINFVVARGSIRSCEKAFRSFRYENAVRIILLASDKSISGVHLVEANHLIAVHPMLCSRGVDDEYATLWQAIGRIRRLMQRETCHVWQMVTQNTIEEQLYDSQTALARQKQAMDVGISWDASLDEVAPAVAAAVSATAPSTPAVEGKKKKMSKTAAAAMSSAAATTATSATSATSSIAATSAPVANPSTVAASTTASASRKQLARMLAGAARDDDDEDHVAKKEDEEDDEDVEGDEEEKVSLEDDEENVDGNANDDDDDDMVVDISLQESISDADAGTHVQPRHASGELAPGEDFEEWLSTRQYRA
jgi:SNF2 family DNA or RNA helicase